MEKLAVPMPRRNRNWLSVVPDLRKLSDGTRYCALSILTPPWLAMVSPETTVTASGTSCNFSLRFCAVTTISTPSSAAASTAAVCCANAATGSVSSIAALARSIVV